MIRECRYVPEGGGLVEVVTVCIQNRHLLRPSAELNDLFLGVIAYAQRATDMQVICLSVMSTHYHLLVRPADAEQQARFMNLLNCCLSKEIGRLVDWPGALWHDRYHATPVSDEEGAQVARLKYLLAQGCKEGLVDRPQDWPGINSARALVDGEPLAGHWYDRTAECKARRRKDGLSDPRQFAERLEVVLTPLPAWAHLSPTEQRRRAAALVAEIEAETRADRQRTNRSALGTTAVLRVHPHHRPAEVKKSPKPRFHAATRAAFEGLREAYAEIQRTYRDAAGRLKRGDLTALVRFPPGTFPPAAPFVAFALVPGRR